LKKNVKDVIGVEKKKRNEIEKEINDVIEKVLKQDEKDKDEEEEMYRSFEELHSEKGELNRNIQQSISSIDNIDYDNI
jgi:seryl-tRNA synthetase